MRRILTVASGTVPFSFTIALIFSFLPDLLQPGMAFYARFHARSDDGCFREMSQSTRHHFSRLLKPGLVATKEGPSDDSSR